MRGVCIIADCARPTVAHRLCKRHYATHRPNAPQCAADECIRPAAGRGYCTMHYQRVMKFGDPNKVLHVFTPHGEKRGRKVSPEYTAWQRMRGRCGNPGHPDYRYYGGRGIRVCPRWDESFPAFLEDVGRRPSHDLTLDRIDTNGNYEPGNVRWATRAEQSRNRRPFKMHWSKSPLSKPLTVDGIVDSIGAWSRRTGIPRAAIRTRLKLGWSPERAVTVPTGSVRSLNKLTPEAVRIIRASCANGEPVQEVARRLGVHRATVKDVVDGRTWRHVS